MGWLNTSAAEGDRSGGLSHKAGIVIVPGGKVEYLPLAPADAWWLIRMHVPDLTP